jgi:hypothetical protein
MADDAEAEAAPPPEEPEGAAAEPPPEEAAADEPADPPEEGGEAPPELDGSDAEAAAATKIAAMQRGKKARREMSTKSGAVAEGAEDAAPEDGDAGDGEAEAYEAEEGEEEGEEEDDGDFEEEVDGDDPDGGYGDFDMLEAAEVDADEEQREEDKANLAELFKQAQEEKATFLDLNQTLQRKLSDHLRTVKKADEGKDVEKTVTDQEQRYYKCLSQVNELRDELKRLQQQNSKAAVEMKRRLDDKQTKAEEIKAAFVDFKREILKGAENSRTSKPIPDKLINQFEKAEGEKDSDLEKMRLSNINRRNHLRKLEQTLRQKEKLADGLHLIDFEQLKIENQTLNEKIEERNGARRARRRAVHAHTRTRTRTRARTHALAVPATCHRRARAPTRPHTAPTGACLAWWRLAEELLKLRKKTTTTVQVLTHLKEKLQFVQAENQVRKHELSDFEVELTSKRDMLTQVKHDRDALRGENAARRQQRGLVSSEELLIDYEKRRLDIIAKKEQVTNLDERYEQLTQETAALKHSIAAAGGIV